MPRIDSLLWLLWLLSSNVSASTSTATATSTAASNEYRVHPESTETDRKQDANRALAVYALYNAPPFAVTFRTKSTPALEEALVDSTTLLSETGERDSSLSYPIRTVTQTFLLEHFHSYIEDYRQAIPEGESFFQIYDHLVAVDIQTKLYVDDLSESIRRDRARTRRKLDQHVTLVAEMFPTLAFLEPEDKSTKPSNQQVRERFGSWLEDIFENHRDKYLRELVQSDQELLREISALEIETGIDEKDDTGGYVDGWSTRTEKALLTMLVLLTFMGLGWMFLYLQQRHRHKLLIGDEPDRQQTPLTLERPSALTSRERLSSMDAVRHGSDTFHSSSQFGASQILEKSDKYLSKHRPDLYEDNASEENEISVFGRSYQIPSNPFEYIYSAFAEPQGGHAQTQSNPEFQPSPRGAFTPRRPSSMERRPSSFEIQKGNIAAPFDENVDVTGGRSSGHWSEGGGYLPMSTIWRNLSSIWDDVTAPRQPPVSDGLVMYSQEMEVFDEADDPEEYDFPFKDFPRHDGTPCLIYNDDSLAPRNQLFVIGSPRDDEEAIEPIPTDPTAPVSDSTFQRMLSQRSLTPSFDDLTMEEELPARSPEFKSKLTRLVQQKHRQYEKRAIVEKHREQRAKERKHAREQERRERHKVMEREIEAIEATFSTPLERTRVMQLSPKPRHFSPKPATTASYSPKVHQSFRKAFSPFKTSSASPRPYGGSPVKRTTNHPDEKFAQQSPHRTRSPAYRPSNSESGAIFRPAPKTSYQNVVRVGSSGSGRSISPPGGIEGEDEEGIHSKYSVPVMPARNTQFAFDANASDLYVDTSMGGAAGEMDYLTLDKLSMPPMGGTGKFPSPQSVMDEINVTRPPPRKTATAASQHRRVNSFNLDDASSLSSSRHQRTGSHQLPPSQAGHRRTHSKGNGSGPSHSRSNSHSSQRRTHSRSNSHSDDVFLHGIFAQTRFV